MAELMDAEPSKFRVSDEMERSVSAFSRKSGVSEMQTRALIQRWGNDHSILTAQAHLLAKELD